MEQITIKNLTFAYDKSSDFSLKQISLQIRQGEILLITGLSGCGKTTLLRHLKREYVPQGFRSDESEIWINESRLQDLEEREQAGIVGFVGQNVEDTQVTDKVWHELAFGLENLGYSQDVMQRKVAEMVAFFGLERIYHERLCNLSGGQKQLVNLASVMAMEPEVLVLDEPTSQLDPIAATEFFRMIEKINRELGTTIVMTEHRLEEVFAMCHRVCVMEQGRIIAVDTPQKIVLDLQENDNVLAKALPAAAKLYLQLEKKRERVPLTVNEGRTWMKEYVREHENGVRPAEICNDKVVQGEALNRKGWQDACRTEHKKRAYNKDKNESFTLHADELWFRYEKNSKDVLKACSLRLEQGTITAILGGNGTGKSTLLNVIAGHFLPYLGKVKKVSGSIGMLPQNPQAMFAKKTVEEELLSSLVKSPKCEKSDDSKKLDREKGNCLEESSLQELVDFCDLQSVLHQHPFDLSGGQMQKLALAKLLLEDKDILLLDEPGKGMDYDFKEEMGQLLKRLTSQGKTVLMVSHDVEFCARYADCCGLFFDGNIVSMADSRSFFLQNTFYTTAVARMCRGMLPDAVVMEDVLQMCGYSVREGQEDNDNNLSVKQEVYQEKGCTQESKKTSLDMNGKPENQLQKEVQEKRKEKKSTWLLTLAIVFLIMPLTIYIGHTVLLQRKYYFISLLLVIEAIACFFLRFEKRSPKVREIMVVAMMSAIVVAGRAAFYMVPNVKPMAALVILTGIGLGAEAGFLVGSMSMLVSDIFFGQGPWTPWQMFAMGLLGFLAGVIFKNTNSCTLKKKLAICIFGMLGVICIYGGIMNPASVPMYQEKVNFDMILSAYAMGFPYDAMHGAATFAFLWVGCRPLLEKMKRVREKSHFML